MSGKSTSDELESVVEKLTVELQAAKAKLKGARAKSKLVEKELQEKNESCANFQDELPDMYLSVDAQTAAILN